MTDPEKNSSWAILADKGYIGVGTQIRIITPFKGNNITPEELQFNKKVGADRVIIENFYGRLKLYWSIIRNKYKGSHSNYDTVFEICAGLTNFLLKYSPLRSEDGEYYRALLNEMLTKDVFEQNEKKEKRKDWEKKREASLQFGKI